MEKMVPDGPGRKSTAIRRLENLAWTLLVKVVPQGVIAEDETRGASSDAGTECFAIGIGRHSIGLFEQLREVKLTGKAVLFGNASERAIASLYLAGSSFEAQGVRALDGTQAQVTLEETTEMLPTHVYVVGDFLEAEGSRRISGDASFDEGKCVFNRLG
jgi:hypothetical protein